METALSEVLLYTIAYNILLAYVYKFIDVYMCVFVVEYVYVLSF